MPEQIYKHVVHVVVFSEHPTLEETLGDDWCLQDVDWAITDGDCIGNVTHESTEPVPADRLHEELMAIGNDGTFFDDLDCD